MSEEKNEQIENPELAKLAQTVQKSEVEKALSETEEKEEAEEEGKEEEQTYPFIGKFFDTVLRTLAKKRGMSDEEIEKYIALNEIEMDGINDAFSPLLKKVFEKVGLEGDEIYALITFITLIGSRFILIISFKPKKEEKVRNVEGKEVKENDQQIEAHK